ncbi:MAG: pentapeptide repeat-containing protein [Xenococcus sp. MO_188.B8]|nr:pentapeptide repeat-containing protein [Xenococcus sp. MO_188.B8]
MIDSTGLGALVMIYKAAIKQETKLILESVQPPVMALFFMTGLIDILNINSATVCSEEEQPETKPTHKTEITTRFLEIAISNEFETKNLADILQIQQRLQSKFKGINIQLVDAKKGIIKLVFEGLEEDLEQLIILIQSGEVTEVLSKTIENVKLIDSETEARELRNKLDTKNSFVREIKSQNLEGRYLERVKLRLSELRGIFLKQANLRNADLSGADLNGANLKYADLNNARLVQTNLTYSQLNSATLIGANLIGADLSNAQLLAANLTDADLSGAKVENTRFGYNCGISRSLQQDLIARGAIFEDYSLCDQIEILTSV